MVKTSLAGLILSLLLVTANAAESLSPAALATPTQPSWSELLVQQKIILAPLSDDWDSQDSYRQKKWLTIAERFHTMSPIEQRRVQIQMQEWGKLSPQQQQQARENFKATSQLPPEKKKELKQKWDEYSQLPAEEKHRLQEEALSQAKNPPESAEANIATNATSAVPADALGAHKPATELELIHKEPIAPESAQPVHKNSN